MKKLKFSINLFAFLSVMSLVPSHAIAQEMDAAEVLKRLTFQMDRTYTSGPYLIYDCKEGHYICVNEEGRDHCKTLRSDSMYKNKQKYPCAPLAKFKDIISCQDRNYEVVESAAFKRFCYPK